MQDPCTGGQRGGAQTCGSRISELATQVFGLAHFGFKDAELKIEVHSSGEVKVLFREARASAPWNLKLKPLQHLKLKTPKPQIPNP